MEALDVEIRKQLTRYLAGELPIADFHAALTPLVWDIERRTDPATASLGREVELLLAEAEHGDWTEEELRQRLAPIVGGIYVLPLLGSQISALASSSGEIIAFELTLSESDPPTQVQTRVVDRQYAKAS
jgi:hypothetical protein